MARISGSQDINIDKAFRTVSYDLSCLTSINLIYCYSVDPKLKKMIAFGVTFVAFVIFAVCYKVFELPYGLHSVWPAFVFVFAFTIYLTSKPLAEENDA